MKLAGNENFKMVRIPTEINNMERKDEVNSSVGLRISQIVQFKSLAEEIHVYGIDVMDISGDWHAYCMMFAYR
jgi:hypothetical protein